MKLPRAWRRAQRAFTLIELVVALAIVATALLGLQAVSSGAILAAGDSINQRMAREAARAKLEEILLGLEEPDSSGELEEFPLFKWTARSEEIVVGLPEQGGGQNKIKVVTLELTYPVEANGEQSETGENTNVGKVTLAGVIPPPPSQPGEAAAPPPGG